MIMKTIADFKRKLKVGVKVNTIFHQESAGRDEYGNIILCDNDKGIREVSIVQSNSFAFKTVKKDGSITDSWCSFPKKNEVLFLSENSVQILSPDFRVRENAPLIPCLTYTFVL